QGTARLRRGTEHRGSGRARARGDPAPGLRDGRRGARAWSRRRRRPARRPEPRRRGQRLGADDPGHARTSGRAGPAARPRAFPSPPRREARCRMTHEEILQGLYDDTLVGNAPSVKELTEQGLEDGIDPEVMLYQALIPSLEEVGARFERG